MLLELKLEWTEHRGTGNGFKSRKSGVMKVQHLNFQIKSHTFLEICRSKDVETPVVNKHGLHVSVRTSQQQQSQPTKHFSYL